ncbi:serine/threonine-protein kinase [Actinomadura parmotrematis]|uniref:Protein kinase n=1 Tax=Actinomadura parmotrematis TaxID=2864039 RepID=A0ABS7FNW9_9ACTN|nr:serine/threonine-protein kinase [Actinomadura parmotrematis]MBW8482074.1 protein kinase [Actinomadura parmotrematis]
MAEALPLQPDDPRRLGGYEIVGRLGVGEQGAVFLGRSGGGPAGRSVAVKLLHARPGGDAAARARFTGAFRRARAVSGFCTAAIVAADVEDGRAYIVAEYVHGPSLQQLVVEEGPRGSGVLERVAVGTAVALAALHRAGAVHHDLKPANVLLGPDGPQVTDFGVAAGLEAIGAAPGGVAGEPFYLAPEQLSGSGAGPAADVFAWAGTLLYAATGKAPFGDDSTSEVTQRIVYDDPDVSALPESLQEIVADALAKAPDERPEARALLGRLLAEDGPLAGRMPASLAAEGRALAATPHAVPAPAAPEAEAEPEPEVVPVSGSPARADAAETSADLAAVPADETSADLAAVPGTGPAPAPEPSGVDHPTQAMAAMPAAVPSPALAAALRRAARDTDDHPTSLLEPVPGAAPGEATALIPGLPGEDARGDARTGGAGDGTAVLSLPRLKRGNHVLGVALSLTIGVLVGIAIIALVLLPQLNSDDDAPPASSGGAATGPVSAIPQTFAGTWKGTATNSRNGISFPIELTLQAGARTATAVYPKEGCTGTLTFTKGTGASVQMALAIAKPCTAGAVQITRQPDGSLQYVWAKALPGEPGYQGRLSRS